MPPWRHTHTERRLGSYQVKGSWWQNRGILTEVVMRCRIKAALSSSLPSLAQEHALHFQSATLTIPKWLTLWKNYTNPLLCSKKKKKVMLCLLWLRGPLCNWSCWKNLKWLHTSIRVMFLSSVYMLNSDGAAFTDLDGCSGAAGSVIVKGVTTCLVLITDICASTHVVLFNITATSVSFCLCASGNGK